VTAGANEPQPFYATDFHGLKRPCQINAPESISIFFDIVIDPDIDPL
jgi:hypothetical protein